MAYLTRYGAKKLNDHMLGKAAWTMPTPYLGLSTTDPGVDGSFSGEPSGAGYVRLALSANMTATDLLTGKSTNSVAMAFGPATGSWGSGALNYFFVADAISGGNIILVGQLTTATAVNAGDSPPIPEGAIEIGALIS